MVSPILTILNVLLWCSGARAHAKGDYVTAANYWQRGADKGYPVSQYNLAMLYKQGRGVRRDVRVAFRLFARAANHDCTPALVETAKVMRSHHEREERRSYARGIRRCVHLGFFVFLFVCSAIFLNAYVYVSFSASSEIRNSPSSSTVLRTWCWGRA